jgi:hypothetical protein
MKLLDSISIEVGGRRPKIELYSGDLAAIPQKIEIDLLIVSAFPDDYTPNPISLIGALARRGLHVAELARCKAMDLRAAFGSWLSEALAPAISGLPYRRILCFEPLQRGKPPEVVGDVFRALAPALSGPPRVSSVAMPLIAAGNQGYGPEEILPPLIDAAVNWLRSGMPLSRLMIFVHNPRQAETTAKLFATLKPSYETAPRRATASTPAYDVLISYSRSDSDAADAVAATLTSAARSVFLDRLSIDIGYAWQQQLYDAIDRCRYIAAIYSPDYVLSKLCQEEFNLAAYRARKQNRNLIFPLYWRSAELPTYMEMIQSVDCREANRSQLVEAAQRLVAACDG